MWIARDYNGDYRIFDQKPSRALMDIMIDGPDWEWNGCGNVSWKEYKQIPSGKYKEDLYWTTDKKYSGFKQAKGLLIPSYFVSKFKDLKWENSPIEIELTKIE